MQYENNKPVKVTSVVISSQHSKDLNQEKVRELVIPYISKSIPNNYLQDLDKQEIYINPTGQFIIGGPDGDTGLTGRKIIVDTYGGSCRHGGGAFSGKDCTKVDRTGAYAARWVAKNCVAAGLADRMEVQLSYAIGVSEPISIMVDTHRTNKIPENEIVKKINQNFDLSPGGIIENLNLRRPIYKQTASYGHFGRNDINLPWEELNMVEKLQ